MFNFQPFPSVLSDKSRSPESLEE
uniref:Uncharacterized protein n=1 Tax=Tetraselmis sp. GSL018 TaxID=582737 RepID=A0A061QNG4_9CHLO